MKIFNKFGIESDNNNSRIPKLSLILQFFIKINYYR